MHKSMAMFMFIKHYSLFNNNTPFKLILFFFFPSPLPDGESIIPVKRMLVFRCSPFF